MTVSVGLLMCACCSEDVAEQVEKNDFKSYEDVTSEIMSFDSKDDFKKALDNYDDTKNITRSLTAFSSIEDVYNNPSREGENTEEIGFLVPNEKIRHFLNKNLEIIVGDTLYRITKNGTFFTHRSNRKELGEAIEKILLAYGTVNPLIR